MNEFEGKVIDEIISSWGSVTIKFKDGSRAISRNVHRPSQEGQYAYTDVYFELVTPAEPSWEEQVEAAWRKL